MDLNRNEQIENNISFLNSILQKATSLTLHIDSQANILIGISLAVAAFSVTHTDLHVQAFGILSFFSLLATIFGLYSVHPPRSLRKQGQEESLLYNKRITSFKNSNNYKDAILKVIDDKDAIVKEYSEEIFNVYQYYYRPKRRLFKIARNILMIGVIISTIIYFIL